MASMMSGWKDVSDELPDERHAGGGTLLWMKLHAEGAIGTHRGRKAIAFMRAPRDGAR
jgi:hypothetical protein